MASCSLCNSVSLKLFSRVTCVLFDAIALVFGAVVWGFGICSSNQPYAFLLFTMLACLGMLFIRYLPLLVSRPQLFDVDDEEAREAP